MSASKPLHTLTSKQKFTLLVSALIGVTAIAYMVVDGENGSSCASVFEQTAPRLQANLEIIQSKGEIAVSRDTIQQLTESAQRVGLHLKTCCSVLKGGQLDAGQFQQCVDAAADYDRQVSRVAQQVLEAEQAQITKQPEQLAVKTQAIQQAITVANNTAVSIARQAVAVSQQPLKLPSKTNKGPAPGITSAETEPNNSILEANASVIGNTMTAEITDTKDQDFFVFTLAGDKRDRIEVRLINQSTTLRPHIKLYNTNKSQFDETYDNTAGANVSRIFSAVPGESYHLQVLPFNSKGQYAIEVEALQAYDHYEPNDDVFTAADMGTKRHWQSNIMDNTDIDWFKITAAETEQLTFRLEGLTKTYRPHVIVYNGNKSQMIERYDNTYGSSIEVSFKATPGAQYYIQVHPFNSRGKYRVQMQ